MFSAEEYYRSGIKYHEQGRYDLSFQCFLQAAENGLPEAMFTLSFSYYNGRGTPSDEERSFFWIKKAAECGLDKAWFALALHYAYGIGTSADPDNASYWLEKAKKAGEDSPDQIENVQREIWNLYNQQGIRYLQSNEKEKAFEVFYRCAREGDACAMCNLSACYKHGDGTDVDFETSFQWMKRSAECGFPEAWYHLSWKYLMGEGTEADLDQAEFWAKKSSGIDDQHRDQAEILLESIIRERQEKEIPVFVCSEKAASDYAKGKKLFSEKKYRQGLEFLEAAGRAGHPEALRMIGDAWMYGWGVSSDVDNALPFYTAAAYRGDREAVIRLALCVKSAFSLLPWRLYAKCMGMKGCDRSYQNGLNAFHREIIEQKPGIWLGPMSRSARDAMTDAARCNGDRQWARSLCRPIHQRRVMNMENEAAYFRNAAAYGNLDGLCGFAGSCADMGDEEFDRRETELYKTAAYMGHSYAMFRIAQYYEWFNPGAARKCYRVAAKWGYRPAIFWCRRNDDSRKQFTDKTGQDDTLSDSEKGSFN